MRLLPVTSLMWLCEALVWCSKHLLCVCRIQRYLCVVVIPRYYSFPACSSLTASLLDAWFFLSKIKSTHVLRSVCIMHEVYVGTKTVRQDGARLTVTVCACFLSVCGETREDS